MNFEKNRNRYLKTSHQSNLTCEERTKEDVYTMQELNGLVYYVRTCCDRKDVLNLIEALNIEVMKIER